MNEKPKQCPPAAAPLLDDPESVENGAQIDNPGSNCLKFFLDIGVLYQPRAASPRSTTRWKWLSVVSSRSLSSSDMRSTSPQVSTIDLAELH